MIRICRVISIFLNRIVLNTRKQFSFHCIDIKSNLQLVQCLIHIQNTNIQMLRKQRSVCFFLFRQKINSNTQITFVFLPQFDCHRAKCILHRFTFFIPNNKYYSNHFLLPYISHYVKTVSFFTDKQIDLIEDV